MRQSSLQNGANGQLAYKSYLYKYTCVCVCVCKPDLFIK